MTTAEKRMEAISRAYAQAVAAACGLTFSQRSADYGIDLQPYDFFHPELFHDEGATLRQFLPWKGSGLRHLDTVARLLVSLCVAHSTTPDAILAELTAGVRATA